MLDYSSHRRYTRPGTHADNGYRWVGECEEAFCEFDSEGRTYAPNINLARRRGRGERTYQVEEQRGKSYIHLFEVSST